MMWVVQRIAAFCQGPEMPPAVPVAADVPQVDAFARVAQLACFAAAAPVMAVGVRHAARTAIYVSDHVLSSSRALSSLPVSADMSMGMATLGGASAAFALHKLGLHGLERPMLTAGATLLRAGMCWRGNEAGALASLSLGLTETGLGTLCADTFVSLVGPPANATQQAAYTLFGGAMAPLAGAALGLLGDTPVAHGAGLFFCVAGGIAVLQSVRRT